MIAKMRELTMFYLAHFTQLDFFALIWIFAIFLLILIISAIIISKRPILGIILLLLDIIALVVALFITPKIIDSGYRAREISPLSVRQLHFSPTTIVDLNITNNSQNPFKTCRITVQLKQNSPNKLKNLLYSLKPLRTQTQLIDGLAASQKRAISFVFDNLAATNIRAVATSECF